MGEASTTKLIIRYQGLFSWEGLYTFIIGYMTGRNYDYEEHKFKQKQAGELGYEVGMKMQFDSELTDWMQFYFTVGIEIYDMHDKQGELNGKPFNGQWGRMVIETGGKLEYDFQGLEESGGKLAKFVHNNLMQAEIDNRWIVELETIHHQLHNAIKEYLGLESARFGKVVA